MVSRTSIKLPQNLKDRIAALAEKTGRSAHSLMVDALQREVEREERMQDFVEEAQKADSDIDRTGKVYAAQDVHDWLGKLAAGEKAARPKPQRR